jgi:hypothetical protein
VKKYKPGGFIALSNKFIALGLYFTCTPFTPEFFRTSYTRLLYRARDRPIQTNLRL